jgi:hypothetical protein
MKHFDFIKDLFSADQIQQIRIEEVAMALNDASVRAHWLREVLLEIQNINTSIDTDLIQKKEQNLTEKSARRRALQFVLEQVLTSRRSVQSQQVHNPATGGFAGLTRRP